MKVGLNVLLLILSCGLNLRSAAGAAPVPPKPPNLEVSIAVPEEAGHSVVRLSTADPHFDVVIRNASDQPLDFFAEDCSVGYDTLRLELLSIDGKPLAQPVIVKRSVSNWYSNVIRTVTLEPSAVTVREIHLTKDESFKGIAYDGFPPMRAGDVHVIRIRAVLEVGQGDVFVRHFHRSSAHSVSSRLRPATQQAAPRLWTGRVVSEARDYRVEQYSP